MEVPQVRVSPERTMEFGARYDASGKPIDPFYLPYTAVAVGDPDFPVLVYVYQDSLAMAWGRLHREGEEDLWARYLIQDGEAIRAVTAWFYDAKARRWISGAYPSPFPPRWVHAVPAGSAEDLAKLFGLPLWRRSELLARFGLRDPFAGPVDSSTLQPVAGFVVSPAGMERRK